MTLFSGSMYTVAATNNNKFGYATILGSMNII